MTTASKVSFTYVFSLKQKILLMDLLILSCDSDNYQIEYVMQLLIIRFEDNISNRLKGLISSQKKKEKIKIFKIDINIGQILYLFSQTSNIIMHYMQKGTFIWVCTYREYNYRELFLVTIAGY